MDYCPLCNASVIVSAMSFGDTPMNAAFSAVNACWILSEISGAVVLVGNPFMCSSTFEIASSGCRKKSPVMFRALIWSSASSFTRTSFPPVTFLVA